MATLSCGREREYPDFDSGGQTFHAPVILRGRLSDLRLSRDGPVTITRTRLYTRKDEEFVPVIRLEQRGPKGGFIWELNLDLEEADQLLKLLRAALVDDVLATYDKIDY